MKKTVLALISVFTLLLAGCGKEDTPDTPETNIPFSDEKGVALGIADFTEEEPEISIKNIVTYVGKEIDYSTGVEVSNTEKYEDFQMWVDASAVDIHTIGSYEAVYRFVYGDKSKEIKVIVSVVENTGTDNEPSGDSIAINQPANGSSNNNNSGTNNTGVGNGNSNSGENNGGNNSGNAGNNNNVSSNNENSNSENGNGGNAGGGNSGNNSNNNSNNGEGNGSSVNNGSGQNNTATPQQTNSPQPTAGNSSRPSQNNTAQTTTARRQIVTSSGQSDTKAYSLGYMNIELLSGSVVKIKCTSSKYIVSTHTESSVTSKSGVNYNVYKLVVTYNTGAQQVLETYEEKIN